MKTAEEVRPILQAQRYVQALTFEQFQQDDRTLDAVLRNLEVIGEAARQVPERIR